MPAGLVVQVTGGPAFLADIAARLRGRGREAARRYRHGRGDPAAHHLPQPVAVDRPARRRRPGGAAHAEGGRLCSRPHLGIVVDASAAGITSVLVFGAATDYALLLIARYRDRLRTTKPLRRHAARGAPHGRADPGLGCTVTLACSHCSSRSRRRCAASASPRPSGSWSLLTGLIVLPAAMVVFGRGLFWPFVRVSVTVAPRASVWGRIGTAVERRPRVVGIGASVSTPRPRLRRGRAHHRAERTSVPGQA